MDQWPEEPQTWNLYGYVSNQPLRYVDPFGLWREIQCTSGKGKCWEADKKGDTITGLAKILNVSADALNKHFQNPTVQFGGIFDVSGFNGGNVPIIRDTGPAVVQVFLVREETAVERFERFRIQEEEKLAQWQAQNQETLNMLMGAECNCYVGIFSPGGMRLDRTMKVHGTVPRYVPRHWTRLELEETAAALRQSIQTRKAEQLRLGEDGPHRARIQQEERFLRQIERQLGVRGPK